MNLLIFILCWIICGVFAYGITFAYFQSMFPSERCDVSSDTYDDNMNIAFIMGFSGPFGLIIALINSGFARHGLKWK